MHKMNYLLMITVGLIAIFIDCYAGWALFLMTVMAFGVDYTLPYFILVCSTPILFIYSIIGLFNLKRWGRNIFVVMTLLLSLGLLYVYLFELRWKYIKLEAWLILFMAFIPTFLIYFSLPSTRALFSKKYKMDQ